MDEKKQDSKNLDRFWGFFFLSCFITLILGGIITKRVYGHPEYMMLFHFPGAIFLVLGWNKLTKNIQKKNQEKDAEFFVN